MRQFKDSGGVAYEINLTIGTVTRVKNSSDGKFNLFEPQSKVGEGDETLLEAVFTDLPTFWELLVYLVNPPDAEAFGQAMAAECLLAAQSAFVAEWTDFFRQLQRDQNRVALEKTAKVHAVAIELAKLQLAKLTEGMDEKVTAKMEAVAKSLLGDSQAKLASILDPSPSATSG